MHGQILLLAAFFVGSLSLRRAPLWGEWLNAPDDERVTVLGHPCRIIGITAFTAPPGMVGMRQAIRQALLFDPLPEVEARRLLADLVVRMSVLSFQEGETFEIPHQWVGINEMHGSHDLGQPALIPARFESIRTGGAVFTSSSREASHFLERPSCRSVRSLPTSAFLLPLISPMVPDTTLWRDRSFSLGSQFWTL